MEELDLSEEKYLLEKLAGRVLKKRVTCAISPYDNLFDPNLGFKIRDETYEEWANRVKEENENIY